jgi:hypothetical protein
VALYLTGGVCNHDDEAVRLCARAVELTSRAPFFLGYLGWAQASAGRTDDARATLAELESRAATEYVLPLAPAVVCAALGDLDRAFELLDDAVERHCSFIASPHLPMFDGFRSDPRFAEHLRRIGQPEVE